MSRYYVKHYNERHAEKVSSHEPSPESSEYQRLHKIKSMIPPDVQTILDCGCGDGRLGNMLKGDYDVQGCDIAQAPLKWCQFPVIQCPITELPFEDKSFDLVICGEVLEHILPAQYEHACRQLERVAKKWILITVPNREVLDISQFRCPHCQTITHDAWHVRSMDKNILSNSFRGFSANQWFHVGQKIRLDLVLKGKLRNRLLGYPRLKSNIQCPFCGCYGTPSGEQGAKPSTSASAANRPKWYSAARKWALSLVPGRSRWLGALLERKETESD
jgi:SAM-dependent methyltransferase